MLQLLQEGNFPYCRGRDAFVLRFESDLFQGDDLVRHPVLRLCPRHYQTHRSPNACVNRAPVIHQATHIPENESRKPGKPAPGKICTKRERTTNMGNTNEREATHRPKHTGGKRVLHQFKCSGRYVPLLLLSVIQQYVCAKPTMRYPRHVTRRAMRLF